MNKNKIILYSATALLILVVAYMLFDLFFAEKQKTNQYRYKVEKFKKIDTTTLCYNLVKEIKIDFENPSAITIDKNDNLYLAGNKNLAIYNAGGEKVIIFPISAQAKAVDVSADLDIFVAYKNKIQILDKTGNIKNTFTAFAENSHFTSILVDFEYFFVADAINKLIYKIDFEGNLLQKIGEKSENFKGFIIPSPYFDLAKGREGQVWAVNPGKHQFIAFNAQGEMFSSWKKSSMGLDGFSGCCNPSHIAVLSNGDFVTSEKGLERVKIHSVTGEFKCLIAGSDKFEKGTKGIDLAVDSKDRIFVLDTKKKKVLVFEK